MTTETLTAQDDPVEGGARHERPGYRYYVLAVLILIYMLNFLDRQIIGILAAPLKAEFGMSDSQFGLLGGIAFASVYSTLAIPLAWMADRFSRVWIMTGALAVWSGFTRPVRHGGIVRAVVPVPDGRGRGRGGRGGPGLFADRRLFPAASAGAGHGGLRLRHSAGHGGGHPGRGAAGGDLWLAHGLRGGRPAGPAGRAAASSDGARSQTRRNGCGQDRGPGRGPRAGHRRGAPWRGPSRQDRPPRSCWAWASAC